MPKESSDLSIGYEKRIEILERQVYVMKTGMQRLSESNDRMDKNTEKLKVIIRYIEKYIDINYTDPENITNQECIKRIRDRLIVARESNVDYAEYE